MLYICELSAEYFYYVEIFVGHNCIRRCATSSYVEDAIFEAVLDLYTPFVSRGGRGRCVVVLRGGRKLLRTK